MQRAVAALRGRPELFGAAWLFFAVNVANALAYVYQVVMGRLLPEAEFAVLVSLFAALIIEAQGTALVQSVAAKIVADRLAVGDLASLGAFVWAWGGRIVAAALVPAAILALASPAVASATGFPAPTVVMLGAAILFAALFAFGAGVLQGLGRFLRLGLVLIAQAGARLVLGVGLVLLGLGVVGAFAGATAAIALSVLAAVALLWGKVPERDPRAAVPTVGRFFLAAAVVLFFYAALVNLDALLAPLLLPETDAGAYAAAVTLGKIALFAPLGLSLFLLERTATAHALGLPTRPLLYRVLGAVLAISGAVALAYVLLPDLATRIVFGERYVATAPPIVALYGVVALSNAVLNVWVNYFVGIGRLAVGAVFALSLLALAIALATLARDARTMVTIVLAVSLANQLVAAAFFLRVSR